MWDDYLEMISPWAAAVPFLVNPGNHEYDYTRDDWPSRGTAGMLTLNTRRRVRGCRLGRRVRRPDETPTPYGHFGHTRANSIPTRDVDHIDRADRVGIYEHRG